MTSIDWTYSPQAFDGYTNSILHIVEVSLINEVITPVGFKIAYAGIMPAFAIPKYSFNLIRRSDSCYCAKVFMTKIDWICSPQAFVGHTNNFLHNVNA